MSIWNEIIASYTNTPRDVKTYLKNDRQPLWYYVYVENGKIHIEPAKNHINSCKMRNTIVLNSEETEAVYELYKKYEANLIHRNEFQPVTRHSSYWMGIFKDLGL